MKTYKVKSSAKRATVQAMIKSGMTKEEANVEFEKEFELAQGADGSWFARRILRGMESYLEKENFEEGNSRKEMTFTEAGDPIPVEELKKNEAPAKEKKEQKVRNQSEVVGPCSLTWEIAIRMHEAAKEAGEAAPSRKQVLEACVEEGVTYNTARTQYQAWFKANKN